MPHLKLTRIAASLMGLAWICATVRAADYSGSYEDARRSVVVKHEGADYVGQIRIGEQSYPLTAREEGDHLTGAYVVSDKPYTFTATQAAGGLVVITNGQTYELHRPALNPLAAGAPAAAPGAPGGAAGVQAGDALAKYTVLNKTDVGQTLVLELPAVRSTQAALRVAFPDLARYFGARPTILGAYEDAQEHSMAFVSFAAKLQGQDMKGFVTTRLRDEGAVLFIVFARADVTRAQWAQLTDHPPAPLELSEPDRIKAAMAQVPLKVYAFPNHTGSIGLAEGWTTRSAGEANALILGPGDQKIRLAFGETYYTPESPLVRQNQQLGGRAQVLPVAPYSTDPATALANFIRINSANSQRAGGPAFIPERVINVTPVEARKPGFRGAQVTYDVTVKDRAGSKPYRALIQFEISPLNGGNWNMYVFLQLIAPRQTFRHDLPIMMAQAFSLNEDAAAIQAKSRTEIAAANKRAEELRAANQKIAEAHYAQNRSVAAASARQSQAWRDAEVNDTLKHRSATDFIEGLRGIRTVEDTKTGEKQSVDLGSVHQFVDGLNEKDPGRYREIPLRDEVYPLAGHENERDYLAR